jgi:phosphatidylglycerol:prolipoprotein diacylglycerol transferase
VGGGVLSRRYAVEGGLSIDELLNVGVVMIISGLIGAKLLYLVTTGRIADPSRWVSGQGFTFYGAVILAAPAIAIYLRRRGLGLRYLDAVALGLPLGIAIGRIGDIIYGEHYGQPSDFFLAVRNTHPEAAVPSPVLAYHSGGLYESLIGLLVFAIVWPLRHRLRRPLLPAFAVVGLYAAGRFVEFFFRSDSAELALGLDVTQWTSIVLLLGAAIGALITARRPFAPSARPNT